MLCICSVHCLCIYSVLAVYLQSRKLNYIAGTLRMVQCTLHGNSGTLHFSRGCAEGQMDAFDTIKLSLFEFGVYM